MEGYTEEIVGSLAFIGLSFLFLWIIHHADKKKRRSRNAES